MTSSKPRFLRRAAPGILLTATAIVTVAALDPALGGAGRTVHGSSDTGGASSAGGTGGATDPGGTGGVGGTGGTGETTAADCGSADQVLGSVAMTRFGPVQVAADVAGGDVCSVYAVQYPDGDHESAQINAYAIPALDEAASEVGADFDTISGATYTSEGYRASLQSILDQL